MSVLGLLAALAGCQTGAPKEPVSIPVVLQPLFETCYPNDGAMTLQVFKADGILTSLDLAWKAEPDGDWELEVANAAGMTLANVRRKGQTLTTEGRAADKMPRLTILKDGFLAVDGEHLGLKASELPCVLGYRLPRSWTLLARGVDTEGRVTTLDLGDDRRDIAVTVKDAAKGADAVCTKISWSRYLVFHTRLLWCQTPNSRGGSAARKRQASLSGIGDHQLKWTSADDQ